MSDNGCRRLKGSLMIMSAKSLLATNATWRTKERSAKKKERSLPGIIKFLIWKHQPRVIFASRIASLLWLGKSKATC